MIDHNAKDPSIKKELFIAWVYDACGMVCRRGCIHAYGEWICGGPYYARNKKGGGVGWDYGWCCMKGCMYLPKRIILLLPRLSWTTLKCPIENFAILYCWEMENRRFGAKSNSFIGGRIIRCFVSFSNSRSLCYIDQTKGQQQKWSSLLDVLDGVLMVGRNGRRGAEAYLWQRKIEAQGSDRRDCRDCFIHHVLPHWIVIDFFWYVFCGFWFLFDAWAFRIFHWPRLRNGPYAATSLPVLGRWCYNAVLKWDINGRRKVIHYTRCFDDHKGKF